MLASSLSSLTQKADFYLITIIHSNATIVSVKDGHSHLDVTAGLLLEASSLALWPSPSFILEPEVTIFG